MDQRADLPPSADTPWRPWTPRQAAERLAGCQARWWVSGGSAVDLHLHQESDRQDLDLSTAAGDLRPLCVSLPDGVTVWADLDGALLPLADVPDDADLQRALWHENGAWVAELHVEDGAPKAWLYRRDPRLQMPWDKATIDIDGIPTGAPEVQLLWKALRPNPRDDADLAAVLPTLTDRQRSWLETALLRIHPHSSWAIHMRSPFAPAKASWNRPAVR
ncbi:hypothetical protein AAEX63_01145 [Luteococcus sp. H138]|uniref:hypothetical protein n=1 Tax=unclassified Luteococcus TaxID=2639923 RepID=UPI00313C05FE